MSLDFANPNTVKSIQAEVKLLEDTITPIEDTITPSGQTRARIAGRFYSDGTVGDGMTGDIPAEISLRYDDPGILRAYWYVIKMTNPEGTTFQTFRERLLELLRLPRGPSIPCTLAYDQAAYNPFTVRVEGPGGVITASCCNSEILPPPAANPKRPWKGLGTRVQTNNPSSSAYIAATFRQRLRQRRQHSLRSFSSPDINQTKWNTYEFVRAVSEGKLRLKVSRATPPIHRQSQARSIHTSFPD